MPKCSECGQPMLPKGAVKRPNEYDHAQGCPKGRDPRVDPKAGDVLIAGPQWQSERYAVLRDGDIVQYQLGPMRAVLTCTIKEWRDWMRGAEVIYVG